MTEKQQHILVAAGLLSPLVMALLAVLPPTASVFRMIGDVQNADAAMALKAIWLCGIGVISVFFVKRIREAKALAALFYVALMLPISILTMYAYVIGLMLIGCTTETCVYP